MALRYFGPIEREILDYQASLYGRRSGSELLLPLELPALAHFFPAASSSQLIEHWAVLGGMPYYLNLFSRRHNLFDNIRIDRSQSAVLFCNARTYFYLYRRMACR